MQPFCSSSNSPPFPVEESTRRATPVVLLRPERNVAPPLAALQLAIALRHFAGPLAVPAGNLAFLLRQLARPLRNLALSLGTLPTAVRPLPRPLGNRPLAIGPVLIRHLEGEAASGQQHSGSQEFHRRAPWSIDVADRRRLVPEPDILRIPR